MPRIRIYGPFAGINKTVDHSFMELTEAEDALNLDLDNATLRKRPGYTQQFNFSGDGTILGMYEYVRSDGSVIQLVKAGTILKKIVSGVASNVTGGTGLSGTELASFATVNDLCYFCEGSLLRITDGSTVVTAQIPKPTVVPTVALSGAVGAGNLKGTYDYKYTWYSSVWGQESPASDPSGPISPDNQNVSLTTGTSEPASRNIGFKRLYRRKVSAGETEWHLYKVDAVNTATDTDNHPDADVSIDTIAPFSVDPTTGGITFRYLASQANVLFLASKSHPNRVYFSRVNEPWSITDFLTIGSDGDSDEITGLYAFQGYLVIFKKRSIWTLTGNSKDTFYPRRVINGTGCSSHFSCVEADDVLYFWGERSIYGFDGSNLIEVGERARTDVIARNYSRDRFIYGVHDYKRGAIIWAYSASGSAVNGLAYAYFYRNSKRVGKHTLCPWDFALNMNAMALFSDANGNRDVWFGTSGGLLELIGGNSDNGTGIVYRWRTPRIDGGRPSRFKRWGELSVEATQQGSAEGVAISYYLDGGAAVEIGEQAQNDPVFRARVGRSSRDIRLEIEDSNTVASEYVGLELDYQVCGRL